MAKLLMISGDRSLAQGKMGAFYNTLEEFHKYWDRIDIITPRPQEAVKVSELFGNVYIHPSPWPLVFQPFFIRKKGAEIFKHEKYNIMTIHEYPPFYNGVGARLLWNKTRIPYVLEIMHIPGLPKAASLKEKLYKMLMRVFIKYDVSRAKKVRVINQKQTPGFLVKAGVGKNKLIYIPAFYVDLEIFKPVNLVKEYDLIFVGRLVENKGINLFIEAVKLLDARAIIVGDGPLRDLAKLKIKNWKFKIDIYGWAKDPQEVAELINKSRILVMSSYNEGGPRVILEAMACGVPVVATQVGIVDDVVIDEVSGRIADWDSNDIAGKAQSILASGDEYDKYKKAGLEIVKRFERKEAIKNYADKLKELINP